LFGKTKLTTKKSRKYLLLLSFSFLIIIFFLTSKILLWDDSKILSTPIGSEQQLSTQNLKLIRWEYNPEKTLMEIEIASKKASHNIEKELEYFSKEKMNPSILLPTQVVSQFENTTIIQIENVPLDFKAVALTIAEKLEETEGQTDKKNHEISEWKIYSDYREIKINNQINQKGDYQYKLEHIQNEIEQQKLEIKNIDKSIQLKLNEIQQFNIDIELLEKSKEYQTEHEKKQTDMDIQQKNYLIKSTNEVKIDLEMVLKEANEKLNKLNEKLQNHTLKKSDND